MSTQSRHFRDFYTERRPTQWIVTDGDNSLHISNLYIYMDYLDYLDKVSIYKGLSRPGSVHVVHVPSCGGVIHTLFHIDRIS